MQILRFPHRFQLILFMLAPLVMSLTLALLIDIVSGRWLAPRRRRALRKPTTPAPQRTKPKDAVRVRARSELLVALLATACIGAVFFTPFWSNNPYRSVFGSGSMAGFLAPFPLHDLKELKQDCLLYTSPSPRDRQKSRMPSSA